MLPMAMVVINNINIINNLRHCVVNDRIIDLIIQLKKKCTLKEEDIRIEYELSLSEYRGIVVLGNDEKVSCNEFSKRMELSPSRGSRIIDKMMERKFLNYQSMPGDRRTHFVWLTSKGKRVKMKVENRKNECEHIILSNYSMKQVEKVKKCLEMLLKVL